MNSSKKIEVNSSSLVGLKAELFRKQEELRKERLQQNSSTVKAKPLPKKLSIWSKKNAGVQSRAEKDKSLTTEEENQLDKSRSVLEAKSKLYEQMSKRALLPAEDDGADQFLVDFEQKAIDDLQKKSENQDREDAKEKAEEDTEYEPGSTDVQGPVHPDEEWVDYVDTLGRSRRCMKKDLPELIQMDKHLNPQAFKEREEKELAESLPDLLSSDMHREMMRKKWEEEEEELMKREPGSVHYQNVRFDEVREMGVGYFGFSKDEEERQEQMEMLQHLRDETLDQRTKSNQLKAKRKAALQARLDKVKQRKRLRGELVEEEEEKKEEEEETNEEEEETREEVVDVKKLAERINRAAPVRPWDIGKDINESRWERVKKQVREERPQEFAPCYSKVTAPSRKDVAPPKSYSTPRPMPRTSHDFAPPKDYGSTQATNHRLDGMGQTLPREHGMVAGVSAGQPTTAKDYNSQAGRNNSTKDPIAQALSFFRHNKQN